MECLHQTMCTQYIVLYLQSKRSRFWSDVARSRAVLEWQLGMVGSAPWLSNRLHTSILYTVQQNAIYFWNHPQLQCAHACTPHYLATLFFPNEVCTCTYTYNSILSAITLIYQTYPSLWLMPWEAPGGVYDDLHVLHTIKVVHSPQPSMGGWLLTQTWLWMQPHGVE